MGKQVARRRKLLWVETDQGQWLFTSSLVDVADLWYRLELGLAISMRDYWQTPRRRPSRNIRHLCGTMPDGSFFCWRTKTS
jgi:hypothetical protein